jgi:hypothetical protein
MSIMAVSLQETWFSPGYSQILCNREAIAVAMADSESILETGRLGPLEEYYWLYNTKYVRQEQEIIQPDLIKKREKTFGDTVINHRCAATQMGTGITVERPEENDQKLSKEQQRYLQKRVLGCSHIL